MICWRNFVVGKSEYVWIRMGYLNMIFFVRLIVSINIWGLNLVEFMVFIFDLLDCSDLWLRLWSWVRLCCWV